MKTLISYAGGKFYLAQTLLRLLSKHKCYVEVFGGGANLLFAKQPSKSEVYNDIDERLVTLFRVVRDDAGLLAKKLEATPYARKEYESCLDWKSGKTELERARRIFTILRQTFGGAPPTKGRWGYGITNPRAKQFHDAAARIVDFQKRLRNVQIECLPFDDLIPRYDSEETLFYLDPPYLPETLNSEPYEHMMTRKDHERLLGIIKRVSGMVILSGYMSGLYAEKLKGWRLETVDVTSSLAHTARTREGKGGNAAHRQECIWLSPNCSSVRQTTFLEE